MIISSKFLKENYLFSWWKGTVNSDIIILQWTVNLVISSVFFFLDKLCNVYRGHTLKWIWWLFYWTRMSSSLGCWWIQVIAFNVYITGCHSCQHNPVSLNVKVFCQPKSGILQRGSSVIFNFFKCEQNSRGGKVSESDGHNLSEKCWYLGLVGLPAYFCWSMNQNENYAEICPSMFELDNIMRFLAQDRIRYDKVLDRILTWIS